MKRVLVLIAAMVALALGPAAVAYGQQVGQGPFTSGIQIVNLGTGTATVTVTYYNGDGTIATEQTGPIPANQSVTFFPLGNANQVSGWTGNPVPSGFNGSVVISANQPVTAVSNLASADFTYLDSYNGFSAGSTTVTMPIIQRNNAGFSTWFAVQNAGTSNATVNVSYTAGNAGTDATEAARTVAPGASTIYNQSGNNALGATFVGSATVTSDQPVVVVVNQEQANPASKNISSYPGLTTTDTGSEVELPLIQANNGGFLTGIGITAETATTVTVDFSPNTTTGGTPCAEPPNFSQALAAGEGITLITQGGFGAGSFPGFENCSYVGSATVSTDEATDSVSVVVNQLDLVGGRFFSSYSGFTAGAEVVEAPLVFSNNGGFDSAFNVQNIGASAASNVVVSYGANSNTSANACGQPQSVTIPSIPAGGVVTVVQGSRIGTSFLSPTFTGCTYVGNATITGPSGAELVVVVNQLGPFGSGDTLLTYRGVGR